MLLLKVSILILLHTHNASIEKRIISVHAFAKSIQNAEIGIIQFINNQIINELVFIQASIHGPKKSFILNSFFSHIS
ncbi:hypothetical protein GW891_03455 [bacterium]|nr:hypothetical protein [bacterium]